MTAKNLFQAAHGTFLDPLTCGSSIRYSVETTDYVDSKTGKIHRSSMDATISLSDCNRVITWSGCGHDGGETMIDKIDVAIIELRAAKIAIRKALQVLKDDPTDE